MRLREMPNDSITWNAGGSTRRSFGQVSFSLRSHKLTLSLDHTKHFMTSRQNALPSGHTAVIS